jgi:ATP-dependent protease ClpP protease subunit
VPDLTQLHNLAGALQEKRQKARPNASGRAWFDIRNAATEDTTAVYIFDMIGDDGWGGGVNARDFSEALGRVRTGRIELHISSEGGDVFDGIAIYESLKQHPAYVDVVVDSLAASAASFVAMAGDRVRMTRNARMMLHDAAMGGAFGAGTAEDMRVFAQAVIEMAALLDDLSLNIADIYAQRAGGTAEEWRARMQAGTDNSGTWYSAQAAKEAGLIDGIMGEETEAAPAAKEAVPAAENALDMGALMAAIEGAWSA